MFSNALESSHDIAKEEITKLIFNNREHAQHIFCRFYIQLPLVQVICDDIATNLLGVKFLCWMDDMYACMQWFPLSIK